MKQLLKVATKKTGKYSIGILICSLISSDFIPVRRIKKDIKENIKDKPKEKKNETNFFNIETKNTLKNMLSNQSTSRKRMDLGNI